MKDKEDEWERFESSDQHSRYSISPHTRADDGAALPGPTGQVDVGYAQMDLLPLAPRYEVACDL